MKPEDQIVAYLFAHKSQFEYSTLDLVVSNLKLSLFYGMSPLSDDAMRQVVARWAAFNAPGLVIRPISTDPAPATPGPASPRPDSEFIDSVKKALSTVGAGVTVGKEGANINIGVTGPTANLKSGDKAISLGISWTGKIELKADSGPFHFSGSVEKDKWEMVLSFPQDTYIPNVATLGKVFTEGERAAGKIVEATHSFHNVSDVSAVGALIKPHVDAVSNAVDAVSGLAKASKSGGVSFGFKIGSPEPMPGQQGIPGGAQATFVFTYRW